MMITNLSNKNQAIFIIFVDALLNEVHNLMWHPQPLQYSKAFVIKISFFFKSF
jgi:hypothetical protein